MSRDRRVFIPEFLECSVTNARRRIALITGAASGLGLAIAKTLAEKGDSVIIVDRDGDAARGAASALESSGARAIGLQADVSDSTAVDGVVESAVRWAGGLDTIVNNAGFSAPGPTSELTDVDWECMLDVHLTGTFRCCRAAYPHLAASSAGSIVNMSSMAGTTGIPGRAAYSAAKSGIEGLTRSLATEWAGVGIRVNAVAPGFISTPMMTVLIAEGHRSSAAMTSRVPLGRLGTADEVATVVGFLSSDAASYMTGQVLAIDGGLIINGG